jgi:hypothetical protein
MVVLDPDVAEVFRDPKSVNQVRQQGSARAGEARRNDAVRQAESGPQRFSSRRLSTTPD